MYSVSSARFFEFKNYQGEKLVVISLSEATIGLDEKRFSMATYLQVCMQLNQVCLHALIRLSVHVCSECMMMLTLHTNRFYIVLFSCSYTDSDY